MLKPRLLGSLILFYLVFYKLWEFTVVMSGATPGGRVDPESYLVVISYALIALFGLVLLSYTTGSVGLFLKQKWSAVVVFYTAISDATITVLLLAGALFMSMTIERPVADLSPLGVLGVLPFLLLPVFPIGLGYAARSLRKNPELWQAPKKESSDMAEPADITRADGVQPAWLQKIFWTVLGTGLLLPVALALIMMLVSLVQDKPFAVSGDALFIFSLCAVLFALPYVVLAFVVRAVLRRGWQEAGYRPVRRLFVTAGIFVGMTTLIAPIQYACLGDAEIAAVLMFAPFWPFTTALPGVVAGAIVGLIAYSVRDVYRRLRGFSRG